MSELPLLEKMISHQLYEKELLYEFIFECLERMYGDEKELAQHWFCHLMVCQDDDLPVCLSYIDKMLQDARDQLKEAAI